MRCPTCGNEMNPLGGGQISQQEWNSQQVMKNEYISELGGMGIAFINCRPEPLQLDTDGNDAQGVKHKPKSTAWGQFKQLVRKLVP